MRINTIDDLLRVRLEVGALNRNHARPKGHGVLVNCGVCDRIARITLLVQQHRRERRAWLLECRKLDKKAYYAEMNREWQQKRKQQGVKIDYANNN